MLTAAGDSTGVLDRLVERSPRSRRGAPRSCRRSCRGCRGGCLPRRSAANDEPYSTSRCSPRWYQTRCGISCTSGCAPVTSDERQTGVSDGNTVAARRYSPRSCELGERWSGPSFDRVLVHRRRQPVDDDQQRLSRGQGSGDLRGVRLRAGGRGGRARAARARGGSRAPERTRGQRGRARRRRRAGRSRLACRRGPAHRERSGRSDAAEHAADPAGQRPGQLGEHPAHRGRRRPGRPEREPEVAKDADGEDAERAPRPAPTPIQYQVPTSVSSVLTEFEPPVKRESADPSFLRTPGTRRKE